MQRRMEETAKARKELRRRQALHPHGARKLAEIALLTTLRNLDGLTPKVLMSLDVVMVERIWIAVRNT
jgi:hypothetical protein